MSHNEIQRLMAEIISLRQAHEGIAPQIIYLGECILIGSLIASVILGAAIIFAFSRNRRDARNATGQQRQEVEQHG